MEQPNNTTLDKLKKVELEMLKEVISICQTLQLNYYVLGGTMLGAVRHKGFIPWDDDIDLGMPRGDYEIFLKEAPKYLSSHLFLQTHDTDPEYFSAYAKIRNSNTTFIEKLSRGSNINHGIFLDIFPLDYLDKRDNALLEFKKDRLNERIMADFFPDGHRSFFGKLAVLFDKCLYSSMETAFRKREALFRNTTEGPFLANHSGAWGKKEIIPADWYGEGTLLEFEGVQVQAPKEYVKWLTQVYGDYMKLPPVEKQVTHHETDTIDPDRSYHHYVNY